jgi:hypothetical protein
MGLGIDTKKGKEVFFFEKKNQKAFDLLAPYHTLSFRARAKQSQASATNRALLERNAPA